MDDHEKGKRSSSILSEEMMDDVRRGPWTLEEDMKLINYIGANSEGRWNYLARAAGLKRTGKSCRLRWLNYLCPDIRRGNITLQEQLLNLELHSHWGNRWSKIAKQLPGRTDNEIKNYWITHVHKHAKHLKCDVKSKQFKDTVRYLWIPRLVERIQATTATTADANQSSHTTPVALSSDKVSSVTQFSDDITNYYPTSSTVVTVNNDATNSSNPDQHHAPTAGRQEVGDYFNNFFIPPLHYSLDQKPAWTTNCDAISNLQLLDLCNYNDDLRSSATCFSHQYVNYYQLPR